jgi:Zn-dependent peptidase ImmA (M78 family)
MHASSKKRTSKLKIRSLTKKLLDDCDIKTPPVKLSPIIKSLGITVVKSRLGILPPQNLSAFIDLKNKLLYFKRNDPVVRQRFSVAHEIGHYLMNHAGRNKTLNLYSKKPIEIEANLFAIELLIPFSWIKKDLENYDASIPKLAKKYWVSEEAMGWRVAKSDVLTLA